MVCGTRADMKTGHRGFGRSCPAPRRTSRVAPGIASRSALAWGGGRSGSPAREIFLLWQAGRAHSPLAARAIHIAVDVANDLAAGRR